MLFNGVFRKNQVEDVAIKKDEVVNKDKVINGLIEPTGNGLFGGIFRPTTEQKVN